MENPLKKLLRLMVSLLHALGRLFKGSVFQVFIGQFAFLLSQWDPVQSLGGAGRQAAVYSNIFALFCILFPTVYGIFGLHFEATGNLDLHQLPSSRYIFTHQIFPQAIWKQVDVILGADICATAAVFLSLFVVTPVSERFILFLNEEKQLIIDGKG